MARQRQPQHQPRDLYAEVTTRIVTALEQGVAPWVCPWRRDGEGGRPRNGASGHVYRGINVVVTGMSGFASNRWYTYKQAQALGGQVRRGEKATQIVYWRFIEAKDSGASGTTPDETSKRTIPIIRCHSVFNAQQVGWPEGSRHSLAETAGDLDLAPDLDDVRDVVKASQADLRHAGTLAFYSPAEDLVSLPDPSRFSTPGDYYATALHELAHWTGHQSRLARNLTGRFGGEAYAAEELVAELAAAFLSADLGIPGKLQHVEYIGSWLKVLRGDKRAIFTASRLAQEAADDLLRRAGRMNPAESTQEGPIASQKAA